MQVKDLMSPPTITVGPTTRVAQAAQLLLQHSLQGIPVIDSEGAVVGVITQRDIVAKHARVHVPVYLPLLGYVLPLRVRHTEDDVRKVLAVTVQDLLPPDLHSVTSIASIDDVATLMAETGANPVPVIDDGELVGIVNETDIIRLVIVEENEGS